ncbi:MAG TPA: DNA polymerase III subunit beta [Bacilli bacterium]|nr:DNA polymerase III subunit beta [Bacilli bacterium]
MKFKINREQFLRGLTIASRPTTTKTPIPILGNILLQLDETGLTLLGSNNELAIRTHIPMSVDELEVIRVYEQGKALISSKMLNESIRKMEGGEIDLEIIDQTIAQISDGRTEYRLSSINPDEYPDLDLSSEGTLFDIPAKDFVRLVEQTAFAASAKEQRPILTALNLTARNGLLHAVATDSARLAQKVVTLRDNVEFVANVPAKIVSDVAKLLETLIDVEMIEIRAAENKISFSFGNTFVVSRLVIGEYPQTRNIIPKSHASFLEVNANELLKAMDRVSILALSDRENIVKLTLKEGEVIVSSKSHAAESAKEVVSLCRYTGEPLEISFNHLLVASAVKACLAEDVIIGFNGANKPFSVKVAEDDSLVIIVTPIRT